MVQLKISNSILTATTVFKGGRSEFRTSPTGTVDLKAGMISYLDLRRDASMGVSSTGAAEKQRLHRSTKLITQNKANIPLKTSGQMVFRKINYVKIKPILESARSYQDRSLEF